jgi:hypothetical protein
VITAVVALGLGFGTGAAAPAADDTRAGRAGQGSLLLLEPFDGRSVADSRVRALGSACLTGATVGQAPPAGSSDLGPCPPGSGDAPRAGATPGYLQLTDDLVTQSGGVVLDRAVPAEAGLVIEYDHFMYRTRYGSGADGIGLVLVDGAYDLDALGAFGGSLGYAQGDGGPGVSGAYLGVGFDVYGNFARDVTGRGTGCAAPSPFAALLPNSVTLRGGGDGTRGYCWLASSALAEREQMLDWYGWTTPAQLIPGAQRNVRVTVSPDVRPVVSVEIDFTGTRTAYTEVLRHTMAEDAPATYKLGFAAATGAERNVHLVRDVEVRTVEPLSPLHLVVQVAHTDDLPDAFRSGTSVPFDLVVTNTDAEPLTDVRVHDPLAGQGPVCSIPELGAAGSATASAVCRVDVVVGPEHARTGELVNAATATAVSAEGPVSAADSVVVPVTGSPALALTTSALVDGGVDGLVSEGDTVAFRYQVRNAGDVDVTDLAVHEALGVPVTCEATALAPGAGTACDAAPYVLDAADLAAAEVVSDASASGTVPAHADPLLPGRGTLAVPLVPATVGLAVEQRALLTGPDADGRAADVGDVVRYDITVTNTGDLPVTALELVHDPTGSVTCDADELAAGASTTCAPDTGQVVTEADLVAGGVTATVHAEARTGAGAPVEATTVTTTRTRPAVAEIALAMTATVEDEDHTGDGVRVRHAFEVTSTGTVTVGSVAVADLLVSGADAGAVSCERASLAPGQSTPCLADAVYEVTDADRESRVVVATATATARAPEGVAPVEPVTATTTTVVPKMVTDPDPDPDPGPTPAPTPEPTPGPGPTPAVPGAGPGAGAGGGAGGAGTGDAGAADPARADARAAGGLPVTGTSIVPVLVLVAALTAAGAVAVRARQTRSDDPSEPST